MSPPKSLTRPVAALTLAVALLGGATTIETVETDGFPAPIAAVTDAVGLEPNEAEAARVSWGWGGRTVTYSKWETEIVADWGWTGAIFASRVGVAAIFAAGYWSAYANRALRYGQCLGLYLAHWGGMWLRSVPC